ncbi:hypothetical protein QTI17_15525 [Variovorax sp. J31P179]|uniref:hypothetical protein n=1 Tax=Variovorax sp. J31P179 TaxID=3053508 RepID=UPI0025767843|nr:hypothetical protein [Variovorax sp. J31P179]MDM0082006.1 hypothetical protein [Variovorax sp. J31P179]
MSSNPDLSRDKNPHGDRGEFDFPGEPESSASRGKPNKSRRQVTAKTAVKYRRNFGMMIERAAAALNLDPDLVTVSDLIVQLRSDETLTTATKVTYKASIKWALKQPDIEFPHESREQGLELIGAFNLRDQQIVRNTRVSARAIPKEDLGPVLNGLLSARSSPRNWAAKTTAWLVAGIATGALPGEWRSAYWLDRERGILRLPNAKLRKQAPISWQHIPERLLNLADVDLAAEIPIDPKKVSAVISAAKRHSDMLARNLAFFDQAEAGTDASNAIAIETLRRLRRWELQNAGLAWRDIKVPFRSRGAIDAHLTNIQQYLTGEADDDGEPTFDRLYNGCRRALRDACVRAFDDGRLYSLFDTRSTAAANMQAIFGAEAAAVVMGHYKKRKRPIKENDAGADRPFRHTGRSPPGPDDTQN